MGKKVIFFGAGLSRAYGFPVTGQLLPEIIKEIIRYRTGKRSWLFEEDFGNQKLYINLLVNLLSHLSPGIEPIILARSQRKLVNASLPLVTDLLSQLDHLIVNAQDINDWNFNGNQPVDLLKTITQRIDLKDLKTIFEWAIIAVIGRLKLKEKSGPGRLFSYIRKVNEQKGKNEYITAITTNYDSLIEWNLLEYGEVPQVSKLIDYGFSWREAVANDTVYLRPPAPLFKIFKLHGSVDWLKCERCGHIYVNTTAPIYELAFMNRKSSSNKCHCGYWPLKPVIVTPSYIRSVFDTNLHEIWKASMEELRKADEWIIIGYSLPNEDFNIKGLFLRALLGRDRKPKITVVQKGDEAKQRFQHFFGTDTLTYHSGGLDAYTARLPVLRRINISKKRTKLPKQ